MNTQVNSRNLNSGNNKEEEEPLYIMTIEWREGESASLNIYIDSKPEELAFNFCKCHNLDYSSMHYLSVEIAKLIEDVLATGILPEQYRNDNSHSNQPRMKEECIVEVEEENWTYNSDNKKDKEEKKDFREERNWVKKTNPPALLTAAWNTNKQVKKSAGNKTPNQWRSHYINNTESSFNHIKASKNCVTVTNNNHPETKQNNNSKSNTKPKPKRQQCKKEDTKTYKLWTYNTWYKKFQKQNQEKKVKTEPNKIINLSNEISCPWTRHEDWLTNNAPTIEKRTTNNERETIAKSLLSDKETTKKLIHNSSLSRIDKGSYINYGQRWYEKGIKLKEMKNIRINSWKDQVVASTLWTFQPKLNANDGVKSKNTDTSILNYKEVVQKRIEKIKEKYHSEKENYTFIPHWDDKSKTIDNKLHPNLRKEERINILHDSANKTKLKLNKIEHDLYGQCTFKPEWTVNFHNMKKSTISKNNSEWINKSFNDRLIYYRSKSANRWTKLIEDIHSPADPITGQQFFQPLLYTGSNDNSINLNISKGSNSNIFINWYSYAVKYKQNKRHTEEMITQQEKQQRQIQWNAKSQQVYNQRKQEVFEQIFNAMDRDNDNFISILSIGSGNWPENIRKIISPIIEELKLSQEKLSKENFMKTINDLFEIITPEERRSLLTFGYEEKKHRRSKSNEFTFKPVINNKSKSFLQRSCMTSISKSMINKTDFISVDNENSYTNFLKKQSRSNSFCS